MEFTELLAMFQSELALVENLHTKGAPYSDEEKTALMDAYTGILGKLMKIMSHPDDWMNLHNRKLTVEFLIPEKVWDLLSHPTSPLHALMMGQDELAKTYIFTKLLTEAFTYSPMFDISGGHSTNPFQTLGDALSGGLGAPIVIKVPKGREDDNPMKIFRDYLDGNLHPLSEQDVEIANDAIEGLDLDPEDIVIGPQRVDPDKDILPNPNRRDDEDGN